jgi:site-specific DNA-methyltransferase (adenine-specific)
VAEIPELAGGRRRRPTSTASFGSSRRESHDATTFYERFVAPELSHDATVVRPDKVDVIYCHDSRHMSAVDSGSIALVVTSPPYFAGKDYEQSLGRHGVPSTYFEYLQLLRDVFEECKRVLEPGGRIAVNVANLGRRPFRSLAGDVTQILQDLGLLLRGEIVWWKGRAAGGSCAWGTFQRPGNPVLRDITERIVIASKGRFDRAKRPQERQHVGLPSTATISRDEFLEATTDLWEMPPESATRVGHPAPFPVELPRRLIDLYTYEGDTVLDPFIGSGTTAVAARRTGRHFIGYDNDATYVELAVDRLRAESNEMRRMRRRARIRIPADVDSQLADFASPLDRAIEMGSQAKELAGLLLSDCGFTNIKREVKVPGTGVEASFIAVDSGGGTWVFDLAGTFSSGRTGLRRSDVLWRTLGRAAVLHAQMPDRPLVLLTTQAPAPGSSGEAALQLVKGSGRPISDVVELLDPAGWERLRAYGRGDHPPTMARIPGWL